MNVTICDQCKRHLSVSAHLDDYRLAVAPELIPLDDASILKKAANPRPLDRPHHFCDWQCFRIWLRREHRDIFAPAQPGVGAGVAYGSGCADDAAGVTR